MLRDTTYVDEGVKIVDADFRPRIMEASKCYSDGLHQAIEAKEGAEAENSPAHHDNHFYQNYLYVSKLSGMTGTVKIEDKNLEKFTTWTLLQKFQQRNRSLNVTWPPHFTYSSHVEFRAVVQDIKQRHEAGQPILGRYVVAAETSELLSTCHGEAVNSKMLKYCQETT